MANEALLAGPDVGTVRDAARRRAQSDAERAQYLDELFARQDVAWDRAKRLLSSRSNVAHSWAGITLRELAEAADRQGARSAFEVRLGELRRITSGAKRFWRSWSAKS